MSSQSTRDRTEDGQGPLDGQRWAARPVLAGLVRGAIAVVPVASAILTTAVLVRTVPSPGSAAGTVALAVAILAASTGVLVGVERLSRRFLPLALLLRMSLLFPDKAPPRYRIARRAASVRQLRERVERAREVGRVDEPIRVAEDVLTLIAGLTRHDRRTRGHSERVRVYTDLLTERLGLNNGERERLRWASLIHDIGKLEVPSAILNKPGRPSQSEWEQLKAHPKEGARIAASLLPWLGEWGLAIEHHHERWDGGGYPNALAGTQISMAGRIVSVADAYETMTAVRSYKSAMSHVAAREEVARCAGSQFDPHVVRAFLDIPLTQLVRVAGPVSWLIQLPLLRHLQPAASQLVPGLAASGVNVATAAVLGTVAVTTAASASQGPSHAAVASSAAAESSSEQSATAGSPVAPDVATDPSEDVDAPVRTGPSVPTPDEPSAPEPTDAPTTSSPARPVPGEVAVDGRAAVDEPTGTTPEELLDPLTSPSPVTQVTEGVREVVDDVVEPVAPVTEAAEEVLAPVASAVPTEALTSTVETVAGTVGSTAPTPTPSSAPLPSSPDPVETVTQTLDPSPLPPPPSAPAVPELPGL